jgi:hypothetical protein
VSSFHDQPVIDGFACGLGLPRYLDHLAGLAAYELQHRVRNVYLWQLVFCYAEFGENFLLFLFGEDFMLRN